MIAPPRATRPPPASVTLFSQAPLVRAARSVDQVTIQRLDAEDTALTMPLSDGMADLATHDRRLDPGGLYRVVAWYDNEWGHASRLADLAELMAGGARGRETAR